MFFKLLPLAQAKPDHRWSSGLTRSLRPPRAFATRPSHRLHPSRRLSPSLFLPLERTRPLRGAWLGTRCRGPQQDEQGLRRAGRRPRSVLGTAARVLPAPGQRCSLVSGLCLCSGASLFPGESHLTGDLLKPTLFGVDYEFMELPILEELL